MAGIWTEEVKADTKFFGFKNLPTIYLKRLLYEYRFCGITCHQIGPRILIVETQDLVVLTDIYRKYVPPNIMMIKGFSVISGNEKELIEIERVFREEEKQGTVGNLQNGQSTES